MCLIDWTDLRANVMFEAGVRHATNPLGAVHIVEAGDQGQKRMPGGLHHVDAMVRLFSPIGYRCRPGDIAAYAEMIARFESALAANREGRTGFVYRAVGEALDRRSHPVATPLAEDLLRSANLLESDDQESTGISPILYHEVNKALVTEARVAAAERRLAAWLFISRHDSPEQIGSDARRREQFELLSLQTRRWARKAGKADLVTEIATCLRAVRAAATDGAGPVSFNAEQEIARLSSRVKLHKEEAKDLREAGDLPGAVETLNDAVAMLTKSPLEASLLSARSAGEPEKALAAHLADCLGMIGGNYRRMNRLEDALASFERGRPYEEAVHLELSSSYNLVNAITLPLEMGTRTVAGQKVALTRAVAAIDRQVRGARRNDRWAWADLGQCQLLLGDLDAAATSYQRVRALGDQETLASVTSVLQRLAIAIEPAEPIAAASLREGMAAVLAGDGFRGRDACTHPNRPGRARGRNAPPCKASSLSSPLPPDSSRRRRTTIWDTPIRRCFLASPIACTIPPGRTRRW
jgi:tetratricopeptide (TPR) repeat protein